VKTVATEKSGIEELIATIDQQQQTATLSTYKYALLAEKAFRLIEKQRMRTIQKETLRAVLMKEAGADFNLYRFVQRYFN
jgi:LAO/AO transport system kinase